MPKLSNPKLDNAKEARYTRKGKERKRKRPYK